ncbi:mannitol dehydrogenase family protein [Microbacterium sp. AK031]|uniref:mannitol dehydrogenase family protein n=1 Tax=Microbacterium sp. AK031 TaxID=2723076 RepID=UPI0021697CFE|nr:mannitol dehydrogenase family protein [Microbacterium sp. AK031]MCS3843588.1 fructuronate reductase [Microbacterium sp. AK031]
MTRPAERAPIRIAHLGVGAFHRAHQAWYTEVANRAGGEQWGISAFTGRRPEAALALVAQDCRYDLVVRGADRDTVEHISAIVDAHDGGDSAAWRAALGAVAVVTVTMTEPAYHPGDVQRARDAASLTSGDLPESAVGRIVDGLRARRRAGNGALAIVSCDNLDRNGEILRQEVLTLTALVDPELAAWINTEVSFVSSMVDRITPAATDALPIEVTDDPCAVVTEPASAWVLAGEFPAGRPSWELAGAQFVDDITPFEKRKLWLLNAGHTLLANLGLLRGHATVAEAMADPVCRDALEALWDDAAAVLPFESEEIDSGRAIVTQRFENARIRHALAQIAGDSDVKLRVRVIPVIEERLRRGKDAGAGELAAIAAWTAAVSAGLVIGPELPAEDTAVAGLALLAPTLAADESVRAPLRVAADALKGAPV